MDKAGFQRWLDGYVSAWKSYDPAEIGALFSEDVNYRYSADPDQETLHGREAVVASWLENKDDPGTYDAKYEPVAIDGDTAVGMGTTKYFNADGSQRDEFYNVYVCKFNERGECTEFLEHWYQKAKYRKAWRDELVRKAKAGEIN
jgi:hypothetical protein